ncbi:ATP-binding protein [Halomarina halobia]|uniref:ATP-binding protein n=1 Tax=Halomarina halobia TaxID=3033386 RepID=A0ABD6A9U4_9EURY
MADVPETISVTTDGLELPVAELLTGRGFITGKSGSGKSNTASVIAERLLEYNVPLLVVDTDGEYYGLKEQFELLHVGGDGECDVRVGPEHAEALADLALTENVPVILDVSGYLDRDEARSLVEGVVRTLFLMEKTRKKPFLLLVEEMHEYLPESGSLDDLGEVLIQVAKRGRKRGLGICGMSQRPAAVDKDYITQCDWLVWHRLTWENDTRVVARIVDAESAESVEELADGEAILMTDWDERVRRVQFQRKQTFDAGATPGLEGYERPDLKSIESALLDRFETAGERNDSERTVATEDAPAAKDGRIEEREDGVGQLRTGERRPREADPDRPASERTRTVSAAAREDPVQEFGELMAYGLRLLARSVRRGGGRVQRRLGTPFTSETDATDVNGQSE